MSLNVVTIKPPYLASSDIPALQTFLRKWKTYVQNVETYNEQSGRNANIPVAKLRTCLNSNVLDYICNFELQDADPFDISNKHLLEYFNGQVSAADNGLDLLRLEALLTTEFDRKFRESRDRLGLIDQFRVAWESLYGMIHSIFGPKRTDERRVANVESPDPCRQTRTNSELANQALVVCAWLALICRVW